MGLLPAKGKKLWGVLSIFSRFVIATIFLVASFDKLLNPASFAVIVENYKLLPPFFIPLVAMTLPWVEFLIGVLLLLGLWVKPTALIANGFLGFFLVAILVSIMRGLVIEDCGCFGVLGGSHPLSWGTFFRDVVFVPFSLQLLFRYKSSFSLEKLIWKN